jgi:alpha-tubulin suppressor-like RCC1 family protein
VACPRSDSEGKAGTAPVLINRGLHDKDICQLSVGGCACALTQSGVVYTWGRDENENGVLGRAASSMEPLPLERAPNDIIQVASGGDMSLCVTMVGELYDWGCYRLRGERDVVIADSHGHAQKGAFHATPTLVLGLENERVVEVSTSSSANYWIVRTASGKVYSCGTY